MDFFSNPGMCRPPKIAHVPGRLVARFVIEDCKIQTEEQARAALATLGDTLTIVQCRGDHGTLEVKVPPEDDLQSWIDRIHAVGFLFCRDPSVERP